MTSIVFPSFYEGGYPDSELVVMALLQPLFDLCEPQPLACTWLPDDYNAVLRQQPLVRVFRGGGAEDGTIQDPAIVQVGAICETRADAWALNEFCRQMILAFADGGTVKMDDGSLVEVLRTGEVAGPQQLPEFTADDRLVTFTYEVVCRKPIGLPDYRAVVQSIVAA